MATRAKRSSVTNTTPPTAPQANMLGSTLDPALQVQILLAEYGVLHQQQKQSAAQYTQLVVSLFVAVPGLAALAGTQPDREWIYASVAVVVFGVYCLIAATLYKFLVTDSHIAEIERRCGDLNGGKLLMKWQTMVAPVAYGPTVVKLYRKGWARWILNADTVSAVFLTCAMITVMICSYVYAENWLGQFSYIVVKVYKHIIELFIAVAVFQAIGMVALLKYVRDGNNLRPGGIDPPMKTARQAVIEQSVELGHTECE